MSDLQMASSLERSFIYRDIVNDVSSNSAASAMTLRDFSLHKRTGIRGIDAATVLETMGMPVPKFPNQSSHNGEGVEVLRLSTKEFWLLDLEQGRESVVNQLNQADLAGKKCFSLFCQHSHAWFVMSGDFLAPTLAKVCGVDLREDVFPKGSIAQTSIARVNAIIVSHELRGEFVFSILSDSSSASYLWGALQDAMAEFNA